MHEQLDLLAREVGSHTDPPAYDDLLLRARRVRRRQTVLAAAAAVVVIGTGATMVSLVGDQDLRPAPAEPSPRVDQAARNTIDSPQAYAEELSVSEGGAVLVVWSDCPDTCSSALAIRTPEATILRTLSERLFAVTAVPGGWIAKNGRRGEYVAIQPDGSLRTSTVSMDTVDPQPDDVAVSWGPGPGLYRPADGTVYRVRTPEDGAFYSSGYLTPAGNYVAVAQRDGSTELATWDGRTWSTDASGVVGPNSSVVLAGGGERLWAHSHGVVDNCPDLGQCYLPTPRFFVSLDGGVSWTSRETDVSDVQSLAVSESGRAFVSTGDRRVLRISPGADPELVDGVRASAIFEVAGVLYAHSGSESKRPLQVSEDGGETWTGVPLPGLE